MMDDKTLGQEVGVWREVPHGQLYLERVEAAGMATLTKALADGELTLAWDVARLLRFLSIV